MTPISALLALVCPSTALATNVQIITVNPDTDTATPADHTELQAAIDSAPAGAVVIVQGGAWDRVVIRDRDVIVQVTNPNVVFGAVEVVDATAELHGFRFEGDAAGLSVDAAQVTMTGATWQGAGTRQQRAAIVATQSATVEISSSALYGWHAQQSPIELQDATLTLDGLMTQDTGGANGGVVHSIDSAVSITNSRFADAVSDGDGGMINATGGSLSLESSDFTDGAAVRGGHVWASDLSLSATDCAFDGGVADQGGSVWLSEATTTMSQSTWQNGQAQRGGHWALSGGTTTLTDVRSVGAFATGTGGHMWSGDDGDVTLVRSEFSQGQAVRGGLIFHDSGSFSATNAVWTGAEWADAGGAVYVAGGQFHVRHAVISQNSAGVGAGVAVFDGLVSLRGVIFTDNSIGEALASTSTVDTLIDDSLMWNNAASATGNVRWGDVSQGNPAFVTGSFVPGPYSPALDAGPAGTDLDGTPSDMGAWGGADAWPLNDADGDGYTVGRDCDDSDDSVHEGAADAWYDGVDSDCAGNDDYDQDGDGYAADLFGGGDCDDTRDRVYPDSPWEMNTDGVDGDCDGLDSIDRDGDGWVAQIDCDDDDASVHPQNEDAWYDGIDSDCGGNDDYDQDRDGWPLDDDCDDLDYTRNPGAVEQADDGVDQDCDGSDMALLADTTPRESGVNGSDVSGGTGLPWAPGSGTAPDTTVVRTGCSSTGGGGPSGLAFLFTAAAALLFGRRRSA
jgi:uncharacterized protein (TIGR03382 family)